MQYKIKMTYRPSADRGRTLMNIAEELRTLHDVNDEITRTMHDAELGVLDSIEFYRKLRLIENRCRILGNPAPDRLKRLKSDLEGRRPDGCQPGLRVHGLGRTRQVHRVIS